MNSVLPRFQQVMLIRNSFMKKYLKIQDCLPHYQWTIRLSKTLDRQLNNNKCRQLAAWYKIWYLLFPKDQSITFYHHCPGGYVFSSVFRIHTKQLTMPIFKNLALFFSQLYCWNNYYRQQKHIHQHWRRKHRFWAAECEMISAYTILQQSDLTSQDHSREEERRDKNHVNLARFKPDPVWSHYNEINNRDSSVGN